MQSVQMLAHNELSSLAFSHASVLPWENADLNAWPTTQYVHVCSMMLAMSLVTLPNQHCPLWFAGSQLISCPFIHEIGLVHLSKAPHSKDQWLHGRARKLWGTDYCQTHKGTLVRIIRLQSNPKSVFIRKKKHTHSYFCGIKKNVSSCM